MHLSHYFNFIKYENSKAIASFWRTYGIGILFTKNIFNITLFLTLLNFKFKRTIKSKYQNFVGNRETWFLLQRGRKVKIKKNILKRSPYNWRSQHSCWPRDSDDPSWVCRPRRQSSGATGPAWCTGTSRNSARPPARTVLKKLSFDNITNYCSVGVPWNFGTDPDPRTIPLTNESGSGSCCFLQWPSRWQLKMIF